MSGPISKILLYARFNAMVLAMVTTMSQSASASGETKSANVHGGQTHAEVVFQIPHDQSAPWNWKLLVYAINDWCHVSLKASPPG